MKESPISKDRAIELVRMAFETWFEQYGGREEEWHEKDQARDFAIEAIKKMDTDQYEAYLRLGSYHQTMLNEAKKVKGE